MDMSGIEKNRWAAPSGPVLEQCQDSPLLWGLVSGVTFLGVAPSAGLGPTPTRAAIFGSTWRKTTL